MTRLLKNPGRRFLIKAAAFILLSVPDGFAREPYRFGKYSPTRRALPSTSAEDRPIVEYGFHRRGNMQLAVANNGTFGTYGQAILDPFTGDQLPSCIYPRLSDMVYLWVGAFWIGAIVGRDTLVSVGTEDFYVTQEFWPDLPPFGSFREASIDRNSKHYSPKAYSEEDLYCEYTDTVVNPSLVARDQFDNRAHRPLGIKVEQRSMSWSYEYADDFILFDYRIQNIGLKRLTNVYMGIWVDGDVWHVTRNGPEGWNDDMVGFLFDFPAPEGFGCMDTVRIAYHMDNDGDPIGTWNDRSVRSAVGTRVVRTPSESLSYSYNWWIINYGDPSQDFGPRRLGTPTDPFRPMGSRLGTPEGDANKYYIMSHPEFDYDLMFTGVDKTLQGWQAPPSRGPDIARGYDSRYLLSFGPFVLEPGQSLPISFAWVGGENVHVNPNDYSSLFSASNPEIYYKSLDFSELALNARWAGWVYDNPGVDTDSNGTFGKYRFCDDLSEGEVRDTQWYEGDGVPDFRGAGPPPAPRLRIIPSVGKLVLRWNGFYSETAVDVFSRKVDFEGYRVYLGLDERPASLSPVLSFDRLDFRRYVYKQTPGGPRFVSDEIPYTLDSLRLLYDDPSFDPLDYPRTNLLFSDGVYAFFEPQDFNSADLSDTLNGIHKVYPDLSVPSNNPADWTPEEVTRDHGEPLPKYYEYELVLDNLLPTVPHFVAVTAFDFGSPGSGLAALETVPANNMIAEYPLETGDTVEVRGLDAYVYPNPYVGDGRYARNGYEYRNQAEIQDRSRRIHFANLPNVCTISIYSLDGDLIRRIEHNHPGGGPESSHETWDLITRNTQLVVSGIYYWVVESAARTQVGKLVIIF